MRADSPIAKRLHKSVAADVRRLPRVLCCGMHGEGLPMLPDTGSLSSNTEDQTIQPTHTRCRPCFPVKTSGPANVSGHTAGSWSIVFLPPRHFSGRTKIQATPAFVFVFAKGCIEQQDSHAFKFKDSLGPSRHSKRTPQHPASPPPAKPSAKPWNQHNNT